jgi:hypothetical protein
MHYFISASHEMLMIVIKLWIYLKYFKIFFQQKNGELRRSIIFMSVHSIQICLVGQFDRASALSVKRGNWEAPFQRNK